SARELLIYISTVGGHGTCSASGKIGAASSARDAVVGTCLEGGNGHSKKLKLMDRCLDIATTTTSRAVNRIKQRFLWARSHWSNRSGTMRFGRTTAFRQSDLALG